jgi:multimeric flavodoxin WrbA
MQRLFYSAGHLVQNKPAAALAVCRRGGATATLQTMNMMFEMMNMPVVTSQYWNIAYGAGKGEVKLDTEGMQTMRTLATNMAWLLEKIHTSTDTTLQSMVKYCKTHNSKMIYHYEGEKTNDVFDIQFANSEMND